MSHLYLLRHGQTTSNTVHALDTALPGADLTSEGRQQAVDVGVVLAQRCSRPLRVLSSQAARAQQTAALMAESFVSAGGSLESVGAGSAFASHFAGRGFSPFSDATAIASASSLCSELSMIEGVKEISAGDFEMRNDEDAHESYHRVLGAWLQGNVGVPVPGGFTGQEILDEYVPQVIEVMRAAGECDVVLVSHGAVIRFVARFLGAVDPEWAFSGYLANTHFVVVDIPPNIVDVAEAISKEPAMAEGAFDVLEWGLHGCPNKLLDF